MNTADPNLVSHLRFDRISPGGRFADLSGHGRAAEDGRGTLVPDASFGRCLDLDGTPDELQIPFDPGLRFEGSFSIETWVAPRFDRRAMVLVECSATSRRVGDIAYQLSIAPGGIVTRVEGGKAHISVAPMRSDRWHHVAMTRSVDVSQLFVFVDGVLVGARSLPASPRGIAEPSAVRLGYSGTRGRRFRGRLGSLRLYDRQRDAFEIADDSRGDRTVAMTRPRPQAIVHIPFDDIDTDGRAADQSGFGHDASAQGAPSVVADGFFGKSVELDGAADHFQISTDESFGIDEGFTSELWVHPFAADGNGTVVDVRASVTEAEAQPFLLQLDQGRLRATVGGERLGASDQRVAVNAWHHVAVAWDGSVREVRYFVDGEPSTIDGEARTGLPSITNGNGNGGRVSIGRDAAPADGNTSFFEGRIAGLRMYSSPLEHREIQDDIFHDRHSANDAFELHYPISFRLFDDDDDNTLSIVDEGAIGRVCHLALRNDGDIPIEFPATAHGAPGVDNHHIELRFRPATLHTDSLDAITVLNAGWTVAHGVDATGIQSLYALVPDGLVLQPGRRHLITLAHVHAAPAGGARRTRVSLHYESLRFRGDDTPLAGSRLEHMEVVGRRGHIRSPLRVGFRGTHTIVNNGTTNELLLHLANPSMNETVTMAGQSSPQPPSRLIMTFDEAPNDDLDRAWTIATHDQVAAFEITPDAGSGLQATRSTLGEITTWTIEARSDDVILGPGDQVRCTITNIRSDVVGGTTELTIRYENIPEFRDGVVSAVVEKSPLKPGGSNLEALRHDVDEAETARATSKSDLDAAVERVGAHDAAEGDLRSQIADAVSERDDLTRDLRSPEWLSRKVIQVRGLRESIAAREEMIADNERNGVETDRRFLGDLHLERDQLETMSSEILRATNASSALPAIDRTIESLSEQRAATEEAFRVAMVEVLEREREHLRSVWQQEHAQEALRRAQSRDFVGIWNTAPVHPLDVNGTIRSTGEILDADGPVVTYGTIVLWSEATMPAGWAPCDGRTVNGHATPDLQAIQRELLPAGPTFITKIPPRHAFDEADASTPAREAP